MGTVIQDMPQINPGSQPRWDRFERADLFEQYRELRTQGVSERQAAKEIKVPRTTLQAWRVWHDTLDIFPHVAYFFMSSFATVPFCHIPFPESVGTPSACISAAICARLIPCVRISRSRATIVAFSGLG